MNYFADTLLIGGNLLVLASSMPKGPSAKQPGR
jgi:hypothetical protein